MTRLLYRICTGLLLLNPLDAQPVATARPTAVDGVDYTSFYPSLLLEHTIPNAFRKLPKNPVLGPDPGGWDSRDVSDPYVLVTADSVFLFYDGNDDDRYRIGSAVRDSLGWGWERRGPLFRVGPGRWDSYHQVAPVVIPIGDAWRVYYGGHVEDSELGYQWGMAEGRGARWRIAPEPVLALDTTAWDFAGLVYGDIVYLPDAGRYRLYYTGFQGPLASIGMAESTDGITWERRSQPVLMQVPGVIAPDVLFNGREFTMYYVRLVLGQRGRRTEIMRARSVDGVRWEAPEPVLSPDAKWERRQLMRPNLVYLEGRMMLYYTAGGGRWRIGAAYAEPAFVSRGTWTSTTMPAGGTALTVAAEVPVGTELDLAVEVGEGRRIPLEWDASGGRRLRPGVTEWRIALPQAVRSSGWRVVVAMTSGDGRRSPVVYRMGVAP